MKKRYLGRVGIVSLLAVMPLILLTGCKGQESDKVAKAYYVISEELDITKTVDKAQEILENTEADID